MRPQFHPIRARDLLAWLQHTFPAVPAAACSPSGVAAASTWLPSCCTCCCSMPRVCATASSLVAALKAAPCTPTACKDQLGRCLCLSVSVPVGGVVSHPVALQGLRSCYTAGSTCAGARRALAGRLLGTVCGHAVVLVMLPRPHEALVLLYKDAMLVQRTTVHRAQFAMQAPAK